MKKIFTEIVVMVAVKVVKEMLIKQCARVMNGDGRMGKRLLAGILMLVVEEVVRELRKQRSIEE